MMEGRRRVGRRSHARPECCLRLIEATAAPPLGPSVTAAARDGRTLVPAGMEEWLRRGPKKWAEKKNATKQESKMPSDRIP